MRGARWVEGGGATGLLLGFGLSRRLRSLLDTAYPCTHSLISLLPPPPQRESPEERAAREAAFARDPIPWWLSPAGYVLFGGLAVAAIPALYPPARWYYVLVALLAAPLLAVPNSYGCGLTDWVRTVALSALLLFHAFLPFQHPPSGRFCRARAPLAPPSPRHTALFTKYQHQRTPTL